MNMASEHLNLRSEVKMFSLKFFSLCERSAAMFCVLNAYPRGILVRRQADTKFSWEETLKRVQLFNLQPKYPSPNYAVSKTHSHLRAIRVTG